MKNYFTQDEFNRGGTNWHDQMSPELLEMLNEFRGRLGYSVSISPHHRAIGRHAGKSTTKHNVDRYGEVQAIDIMPSKYEPERWVRIAKELGFTGIGFYPDWMPKAGMHLDVRATRGSRPATWGAVRPCPKCRQKYTSLSHVLKRGRRYVRF